MYVPEAVDPICLPPKGGEQAVSTSNRVAWFGYPESFAKSMNFILPKAIELSGFDRKRFCIITSKGQHLMDGVEHQAFHAEKFYSMSSNFSYSLLSHFAHDLHFNTYIKSPNKLISTLVRGAVPLVSNTPAYASIANRFDLEGLLYRSPTELSSLLKDTDFVRDRSRYRLEEVRQELMKEFSAAAMAIRVLNLL